MIQVQMDTQVKTRLQINALGLAVFAIAMAPVMFAGIILMDSDFLSEITNNYLVQSVQAAADSSNSVTLSWTAPGDDGQSGQAQAYDIRYYQTQITEVNWSAAAQVQGEPNPQAAGQHEVVTITGLQPSTTYYFALKTVDDNGNWSALSNVAVKTTSSISQAVCYEQWNCTDWSVCSNSLHTRECTDANVCGTTNEKPATSESCRASAVCFENWSCLSWSSCQNGQMSRSCADDNQCGTTDNKPAESFDCSAGQTPASDTVAPNTTIASAPPEIVKVNQASFIWQGVDDQTGQDSLVFSYQLDDRQWSDWSANTNVTLRGLVNGSHTIRVRTRDESGNIDPTYAEIAFSVQVDERILAAPASGGGPQIRIFNKTGRLERQFFAYESNFRGGLSLASGDLGNDGRDEIVVGPGPGRRAEVKILRQTGTLINSFLAYPESFKGGVNVAIGDFNGDGTNEIATAPGVGGGPNVRVFGYQHSIFVPVFRNFMAYDQRFRGGVTIAACDLEGDGQDEIITGTLSQGGPQLRIFGLRNGSFQPVTQSLMAFNAKFRGGMNLACGDTNGDGAGEIIVGVRSSGGPQVRIFGRTRQGTIGLVNPGFMAYSSAFRGGVSVSAVNIDYDAKSEVMTGVFSGGDPLIRIFTDRGVIRQQFYAFPKTLKNGIVVAPLH